jgi:hypothetical protein
MNKVLKGKRLLLLAVSVLSAAGLVLFAVFSAQSRASLVLPLQYQTAEGSFDLGTYEQGVHEFSIPIHNGGNGVLQIAAVKASCGCTSIEACDSVPSGGGGLIKGRITVNQGKGHSRLLVKSNDPAGDVIIDLQWFGRGSPILSPPFLEISASPEEKVKRSVSVIYPAGKELVLSKITGSPLLVNWSQSPEVSSAAPNSVAQEKGYTDTINLMLDLQLPPESGQFAQSLTLSMIQHGQQYDLQLPIRTRVMGDVYCEPQKLYLGAQDVNALVGRSCRTIVTRQNGDDEISLQDVPTFLQYQKHPIDKRRQAIEFTVTRSPPRGTKQFAVVVKSVSGHKCILTFDLLITNVK